VLDVAHNPAAAASLARLLAERPVAGRTLAVYAALEDKAVALPAGIDLVQHAGVAAALAAALEEVAPEDRVLVFGSFHAVAAARSLHPAARTPRCVQEFDG